MLYMILIGDGETDREVTSMGGHAIAA